MMREETIKVYQFEELSPEVQDRVIVKYRESMDWSIESEFISENFKERLAELGYPIDDVEWRLSFSQGDGVAFYGFVDMDIVARRLLEGSSLVLYNRTAEEGLAINAKLYRNSFGYHYSHWNTMSVEMDGDTIDTMMKYLYEYLDSDSDEYTERYNEIEELFTELDNAIFIDIKSVSRQLEKDGYAEIEYYQSDEAIKESIIANEYEYHEDGTSY